MRAVALRVKPDDYILAVLSPKDRLDAAFRIANEVFKKTDLAMSDIENAVKTVRSRAYEKKK